MDLPRGPVQLLISDGGQKSTEMPFRFHFRLTGLYFHNNIFIMSLIVIQSCSNNRWILVRKSTYLQSILIIYAMFKQFDPCPDLQSILIWRTQRLTNCSSLEPICMKLNFEAQSSNHTLHPQHSNITHASYKYVLCITNNNSWLICWGEI